MTVNASGRTTVLLTGFGPFPSVPANATSVLVPHLAEAARASFPGIVFETRTLPTEWAAGIEHLCDLYEGVAPSVALHFGVSSRARGFEIEARGRNRLAYLPDAAGVFPSAPVLWANGQRDEARTLWSDALKKHPKNEVLQNSVNRFLRTSHPAAR